jgi:hypothetical protein
MIELFLTAILVTGVVPVEATQITVGLVVLVLLTVRSLLVPFIELEPSIVIKLPSILKILLVAAAPVTVAVTPEAGLRVNVFVELAAAIAFITSGNVSPDAAL